MHSADSDTPTDLDPPRLSEATALIEPGNHPNLMRHPDEIGDALLSLADSGAALSLYTDGVTMPIMARVHAVAEDEDIWLMTVYGGAEVPPGPISVATWMGSVKLQFVIEAPQHLNEQLLRCPFPVECLVLERRGSARMETPMGLFHTASFKLHGEQHELQLYDFALGGIGMRVPKREAAGLHVGRRLFGVQLQLGKGIFFTVDLEIRLSRGFRSFLAGEQMQIGCRFVNMDAATQDQLSKLLDELRRQRGR